MACKKSNFKYMWKEREEKGIEKVVHFVQYFDLENILLVTVDGLELFM